MPFLELYEQVVVSLQRHNIGKYKGAISHFFPGDFLTQRIDRALVMKLSVSSSFSTFSESH